MTPFEQLQEKNNKRQYLKYLSCGYTGSLTVNEYGWCNNGIDREKVEIIDVFRKNQIYANVQVIHLPNGKWTAGSNCSMTTYGYGRGVSIWGEQYATRRDAVESQLNRIESFINTKDLTASIKSSIEACRKELQPTLEIALF